eukprot:XP_001702658.1 predicted protein [Chlamydomonas reinhardtii]
MGNRGHLLAVDASWPRLQRMRFNLERLLPPAAGQAEAQAEATTGEGPNDREGASAAAAAEGTGAGAAGPHAERQWRRGCVTTVHADGTGLLVDACGMPLPPPPRAMRTRRRDHQGSGAADGTWRAAGHAAAGPGELDGLAQAERSAAGPAGSAGTAAEGVFDRVLVDAPCSGLGRLQLGRPDSYSHWQPEAVRRYSRRQRQLLLRGVTLLAPGGLLVYSTCTMLAEENEQVLAWLLGRVGGLRLVRPRLLVPAAALAAATHSADGQPPGGGAPAAPPDTSSIRGGAGTSRTEELRAALEAHWPGSTYPPLLQGRWWRAALAAARDGAREQEGRRNGARGPERGPRRKSVEKEQARARAARALATGCK